jgi:hypothetical protein
MLVLPSRSTFRSRLVLPSDPFKYQTLVASDFAFDSGGYTTFTGTQNSGDIDIELSGNLASTSMANVAFANYDTQIPSDPTSNDYAGWLCNIYLSFDTSGFSGGEEQNIGLYFFSGDPDSVGTGTGHYCGGTVSVTSQTNRSMRQYGVRAKNSSALATTSTFTTTTTQIAFTGMILRYGNGGSGSSANKIISTHGSMLFGNSSGWDTNFQTNIGSANYQTDTGSNLQVGFWCSRAISGAFTNNFTINEFSYALLGLEP